MEEENKEETKQEEINDDAIIIGDSPLIVVEPVEEVKEEKKEGLFSKIKGFFKKEVKEETKEEVKEQVEEQPKPIVYGECFFCGEDVYKSDKWSKQQSRLFHRHCYKKFLQAGKNGKI